MAISFTSHDTSEEELKNHFIKQKKELKNQNIYISRKSVAMEFNSQETGSTFLATTDNLPVKALSWFDYKFITQKPKKNLHKLLRQIRIQEYNIYKLNLNLS